MWFPDSLPSEHAKQDSETQDPTPIYWIRTVQVRPAICIFLTHISDDQDPLRVDTQVKLLT
jgi:hypothetical protein